MNLNAHQRACANNRLGRLAKKLGFTIGHCTLADGKGGEREAIIVSRDANNFVRATYAGKFESNSYIAALTKAMREARQKFSTSTK